MGALAKIVGDILTRGLFAVANLVLLIVNCFTVECSLLPYTLFFEYRLFIIKERK